MSCRPRRSRSSTRTCRSRSCRSTRRARRTSGRVSSRRRVSPAPQQEASLAELARTHGALPRATLAPEAAAQARDLLLSDVETARGGCELVLAALRRPEAAHGRPRPRGADLRRPRAPAHHRVYRARRLGVGCHAARRRSGRAEGDRLRDAIRPGVGGVRRVRSVRHGTVVRARRRAPSASGCDRVRGRGPRTPLRRVPRSARRPPDDLRDREAVRRRAEHPAGECRAALGLGDSRARRNAPSSATRPSPTSRRSAAR